MEGKAQRTFTRWLLVGNDGREHESYYISLGVIQGLLYRSFPPFPIYKKPRYCFPWEGCRNRAASTRFLWFSIAFRMVQVFFACKYVRMSCEKRYVYLFWDWEKMSCAWECPGFERFRASRCVVQFRCFAIWICLLRFGIADFGYGSFYLGSL